MKDEGSNIKKIWFECGNCDKEKLEDIVSSFSNTRVVWVVEVGRLKRMWELDNKEKIFPVGVEVWGIYNGRRIVLALKKELESWCFFKIPQNTPKEKGEEWSLTQWGYIHKKNKIVDFKNRFQNEKIVTYMSYL